jgi:hypothetical protein
VPQSRTARDAVKRDAVKRCTHPDKPLHAGNVPSFIHIWYRNVNFVIVNRND